MVTLDTADELLFGTRFLPAIIIMDDFTYAAPTNPVKLATSRVEAAFRAGISEAGECGRGAIITLDRGRTLRSGPVTQIGTGEIICDGLPELSQSPRASTGPRKPLPNRQHRSSVTFALHILAEPHRAHGTSSFSLH